VIKSLNFVIKTYLSIKQSLKYTKLDMKVKINCQYYNILLLDMLTHKCILYQT